MRKWFKSLFKSDIQKLIDVGFPTPSTTHMPTVNECHPELIDTDGSVFELGNSIYRLEYNEMVLVPDGIYIHQGKHAVINNEILVYYK